MNPSAECDRVDAEQARTALSEVIDPEVGINIVDLGLVYDIETGPDTVRVAMTMTTPSCPMGGMLTEEVHAVLRHQFPGAEVTVDLVWEPPWRPTMMSPLAARQLGVRR